MMKRSEEWTSASALRRVPRPFETWTERVLTGLGPQPDHTVADLGVGRGRTLASLFEISGAAHVVAVDRSRLNLEAVGAQYPPTRVTTVLDDASRVGCDLSGGHGHVDALMSIATLHHISDHQAVVSNIGRALRPGGVLSLEAAAVGNVAAVRASASAVGLSVGAQHPVDPNGLHEALKGAGFQSVTVRTYRDPVTINDRQVLKAHLFAMFSGLLGHVSRDDLSQAIDRMMQELPAPVIDYSRVQVRAIR
ncbi:methyltransferase domain-containing protein [Pimelobacter simplex]|uniref:class I SAM-dependent methyltransferase n=1 Tax=Nocardioides simplex TaxID=2045 RepID=UPI000535A962|nr:class I SAM-dependent methyltransferase [Pimelobacter simplex]MCG8149694.1 methyltransferase domain-containing protein [Pimelobacter simplex]GEB15944.1 hypothetical protein NSI01_42590 [Pimelobacter simplex]